MNVELKKAKLKYKAKMRKAMGENWRIISRRLGIYNPTFKPSETEIINNYLKK